MKENELTVGLKFTIKDTDMSVEIIQRERATNKLYVRITSQSAGEWIEDWNLTHTIAGFNHFHIYELIPQ